MEKPISELFLIDIIYGKTYIRITFLGKKKDIC